MNKVIVTFLARVITVFIAFFFNAYVAKVLTANDSGSFFSLLAITFFLTQFSHLGLGNLCLKKMSINFSEKKLSDLGVNLSSLVFVTIIFSFFVIVFCALSYFGNLIFLDKLLFVSLSIIPLFLINNFVFFFQAIRRISIGLFYQGVLQPSLFLSFCIATKPEVEGMIDLYVVSCIITVGLMVLHVRLLNIVNPVFNIVLIVKHIKYQYGQEWGAYFVSCALPALRNYMPIAVATYWLGNAAVSVLYVAIKISGSVSFFLGVSNLISAPNIASLYYEQKYNDLRTLLRKITALNLLFSIPVITVISIWAGAILEYFGGDFVGFEYVLYALLFTQLVSVLCGPVGNVLLMSNLSVQYNKSLLISIMVLVVGVFIYKESLDIFVLTAIMAFSIIIQNVINYYFFVQKFKNYKE